jgi:hypothetical protein
MVGDNVCPAKLYGLLFRNKKTWECREHEAHARLHVLEPFGR